MPSCSQCGSHAINHNAHGRDGSDQYLCDVCYWRKRAEPMTKITQCSSCGGDCNKSGCERVNVKKMIVDMQEFKRHMDYFKKIESVDIKKIAWVKDGKELSVSPGIIEDFKYFGLNNKNFPEIAGWIK